MIAAPKVTVYVPCRNYGRFLREALASVVSQSLDGWELIIFTEGSTDETVSIAREFVAKSPERIRIVETAEPRGLRACANAAIEMARGESIIRLDADDYFDESALLVLSDYLDRHPEAGLVYPNWVYVTETGAPLAVERRKRIGPEVEVPDIPAHGACTLIRRRVLKALGGYDTRFEAQDGHELWLRALHRFQIANVETPLFYYRQHDHSMSGNTESLLAARRAIKRAVASRNEGAVKLRCVAVVPVDRTTGGGSNVALSTFGGRPLIDSTLDCAASTGLFDLVYVSTDDAAVVAHCADRHAVVAQLRDRDPADPAVSLTAIVQAALEDIESRLDFHADVVAILNVETPLRRPEHVTEAIDTLIVYDVDQVVSTYEANELYFRHGRHGLEPVNPGTMLGLRLERESLYAANGAVHALWRDTLRTGSLYEGRIGHIVMSRTDSLQAKTSEDRGRAEKVLLRQNGIDKPDGGMRR
jgi:CMP-N-acetylneuraminic acid synthetase